MHKMYTAKYLFPIKINILFPAKCTTQQHIPFPAKCTTQQHISHQNVHSKIFVPSNIYPIKIYTQQHILFPVKYLFPVKMYIARFAHSKMYESYNKIYKSYSKMYTSRFVPVNILILQQNVHSKMLDKSLSFSQQN
jgi:hypothetical protein